MEFKIGNHYKKSGTNRDNWNEPMKKGFEDCKPKRLIGIGNDIGTSIQLEFKGISGGLWWYNKNSLTQDSVSLDISDDSLPVLNQKA